MRFQIPRRRRLSIHKFLFLCAIFTGLGLFLLTLKSIDPSIGFSLPIETSEDRIEVNQVPEVNISSPIASGSNDSIAKNIVNLSYPRVSGSEGLIKMNRVSSSCATVEKMGEVFAGGFENESLRVRRIIRDHFSHHGASRVRELPPDQFCRHGFVLGKASEAGFGNEMYKILTAAALSIMLNRSLIIGQTRGKFPFGDYVSYTNLSFTLKEVKHLWRRNNCMSKYGRHLIIRIDDFERPTQTNVLCSNWRKWKQPIIWFQGTTDAVAAQFFLKNKYSEMRKAASNLFGQPELDYRPNVFGELMRVIISPSEDVEDAVRWVLNGGADPAIALHMRMLMNRSLRAVRAALNCIKKAMLNYPHRDSKPRVVLVSDTPSLIKDITPKLREFAEVVHFDYEFFKGNMSNKMVKRANKLEFRVKDWGPAPRWVAFVDFFLASRTKYAVISGAQRRVGTTYAQLIAALAAAHKLDESSSVPSNFSFFSSFQSNLLREGLKNQIGWGHVWNRFAGPLSCHSQRNQCAFTPLLPPAWWDDTWQSPIPRDVRRMEAYGVQLTDFGSVDENRIRSTCKLRKKIVRTLPVFPKCNGFRCT